MIFYFSGTGNSRWVAEELAYFFKDRAVLIQEAKESYKLKDNEKVGFVFPIHAWSAPKCILEFINRMKLENYNGQHTYFVCTCHKQTGQIDEIMKKTLAEKGMSCDAGFSLQMPNNYLISPFVYADSEKKKVRLVAQAQIRIEDICHAVQSKEKVFHLTRGTLSKTFSKIGQLLFKKMMTAKKFHALNFCNKCGTCANVCPTKNIKIEDRPVWGENCEMCQACLNYCPTRALQYGRFTKNKKRYFFSKDLLADKEKGFFFF